MFLAKILCKASQLYFFIYYVFMCKFFYNNFYVNNSKYTNTLINITKIKLFTRSFYFLKAFSELIHDIY